MVKRRNARAFAIVDAVVGAVLLGVGLVAVIGLTGQAISSQSHGEQLQVAAMIADERLNEVLAVGPEAYPSVFKLKGTCEAPYEDFRYEVTLEPQGESDPYLVRAEVFWRAGAGGGGGTGERSIIVETLIAPRLGDDPDPDRKPEQTTSRNQE